MFSRFRSKSAERRSDGPPYRSLVLGLAAALGALTLFAATFAGRSESAVASIQPLVLLPVDRNKVALGARLFADKRLSGDGLRSCGTCHDLRRGGVDPASRSDPRRPARGFDAPSVFNAALNYRFGWLAEHRTLAEINNESLLAPDTMGSDWRRVLTQLRADPSYADAFQASYDAYWGRNEVLDALAQFQRSLITPDSRFDRFLSGEADAITPAERDGYELFQGLGCISCHQGRNIGGNLVQKFGIFGDPRSANATGRATPDPGRFALTGLERDRYVFRVPSLRNVAVTGPYLHDGSIDTLEAVVAVMARTQLGRDLSGADIDALAAFLRTLTGRYEGVYLDADGGAK